MGPDTLLDWVTALGSVARRVAVPAHVREAVATREHAPCGVYTAAFALPLAPDAPPRAAEDWARAVFEDAPDWLRPFVVLGWRFVLGLRLRPLDGSDQVLGWDLERADAGADAAPGPDTVLLAATSPLLRAQNIVAVGDDVVVWVTVVRFDSPLGRVLWGLAAPVHHLTIPFLLTRAASA
jgi:hypothetical protein